MSGYRISISTAPQLSPSHVSIVICCVCCVGKYMHIYAQTHIYIIYIIYNYIYILYIWVFVYKLHKYIYYVARKIITKMSNPLHQVPISLKTQARNVERFKLISANSPLSTTYASQEGPKSSQTVELQIVSCFGIEASVLGVGHTELYPHCFFFFL